MIKFKTFTGIDISKKTFDAALIFPQTGAIHHQCFDQTKQGFKAFIKWLQSHQVILQDTLICMEHTGLYTNGIIDFLVDQKANAEYAMRFSDHMRLLKTPARRWRQRLHSHIIAPTWGIIVCILLLTSLISLL